MDEILGGSQPTGPAQPTAAPTVIKAPGVAPAHDAYNTESNKPDGNPAVIAGHREDVESARTLVITGDVLIGVGLVAIGVSIYQLVTRPKLQERGTPSVSLAPTRGGAALMLGGRF